MLSGRPPLLPHAWTHPHSVCTVGRARRFMHAGPGQGGARGSDATYVVVLRTLRTLEAHGGPEALKTMKFNIPTYQRL